MSLPRVLLISLEKDPFFDAVYAHMLAALRARSELLEATSAEGAAKYFSECFSESIHIAAVIVTNASVMKMKFEHVTSNIKQYTINGGTVIFGAVCSHVESPEAWSTYFQLVLALPWTFGLVPITATFSLNPKVANYRFRNPSMPKMYTMKALYVAGKDLKDDQLLYVDSTLDLTPPLKSNVLPGSISSDAESQAVREGPIVFSHYGQGHVGWIGDDNFEVESTDVLIAMCDLNGIVAQGESIRKGRLNGDTCR